jgi:hypothetical protein
MNIQCPVSLGELVDKISILRIKLEKITDEKKREHVALEEAALTKTLEKLNLPNTINEHMQKMIDINTKLWIIEDDIRDCERAKKFDQTFIDLARAVYITNDERFKRKNAINQLFNSTYNEVKSYQEY